MRGKHWRAPGDLGVVVFRVEEQITSGDSWANLGSTLP